MWKLLLPLLLLVAGVLGILALDKPHPRADLVILNGGDASTLDVTRVSWQQDNRIVGALWEGLVRNDVFSQAFGKVPGMAEKWEISPDGLTYTFHIRSNTQWSNGTPFTAKDFVYSWRRALLPDMAGDYTGQYHLIKGARAFTAWRQAALDTFAAEGKGNARPEAADALWNETLARFDSMVALKAPDDRTLIVTLERPTAYFLDICAFEPFYPIYGPLVDAYQSIDPVTARLNARSDWTRPPLLITNGPFQLTDWRFKREMRLEKNPHYWNTANVGVNTLSIIVVEDRNAAIQAYQTGAVDWNSDVLADYRAELIAQKNQFYHEHQSEYDALKAKNLDPVTIDRLLPPDPHHRTDIHPLPAFGTYFYNFNCQETLPDGRPNPFHDPRVRRAFCMSIDRDNIVKNIRRCGEVPANVLVPRNSIGGYTSPAGLPYDPAKARQLLADAGYPGGKGFITVEMLFNRDMGHDIIAQAAKKDWERNLGVSVTLRQKEIKIVRQDLKAHNFTISRGSWFGDYSDPLTFLDINRSTDNNNDRAYNNPAYDQLLDDAAAETDPAKRLAILQRAEKLLVEEDCPLLTVYQYVEIYMFDAHTLAGCSPHPRHKQQLWMFDKIGDGKGPEKFTEMRP